MAEPGMSHWLAEAAKELREKADRKQVHVAAGADVDQSTIFRFETHGTFPRNVDRVIAAYADDLDTTPIAIWTDALRKWEAAILSDRQAVEDETEARARQSEQSAGASAPKKPGRSRKAQGQRQHP